jgi:hypothetical protein
MVRAASKAVESGLKPDRALSERQRHRRGRTQPHRAWPEAYFLENLTDAR